MFEFDDLDFFLWVKLVVIKLLIMIFWYIEIRNGIVYLFVDYIFIRKDNVRKSKLVYGIECIKWFIYIVDFWLFMKKFVGWFNEELLLEVIKEKCIVVLNIKYDILLWRLNFMFFIWVLIKCGINVD